MVFNPLDGFCTQELLGAGNHFQLQVTKAILKTTYLFLLLLHFLINFAEAMYLCPQSIILEMDENVVDPLLASIVCTKEADILEAPVVGLLLCESGSGVRQSPVDGTPHPLVPRT